MTHCVITLKVFTHASPTMTHGDANLLGWSHGGDLYGPKAGYSLNMTCISTLFSINNRLSVEGGW